MLFTSFPTTKNGNIPLIMLATKEDAHSFAWPAFLPGTSNPALPCIASVDLKNDTVSTKRTVDLWLPTPTLSTQNQPQRRLYIAWSIEIAIKDDPEANDGQGTFFFGSIGEVFGPRFQVRTVSQPSRPTGSALGHISVTRRFTSLSGLVTPWQPETVREGGAVTEIKNINPPGGLGIGVDALVYVRCWLPYRTPNWAPEGLKFYIRGMSVEQW